MSALAVFRQGYVVGRADFRAFWSLRTWFSAWMLRIGTNAALWVLLGRMLGSEEKLAYLLVGNAVIAGPLAVGMVIPASTWDRWDGTYSLLVASPSSMVPALLGRTAIWWLHGIGTSLATFVLLGLGFDLAIPLASALLLPLPIAVVCASTHAFALTLGGIVNRAPPLRNVLQNATMPLLMAVCGATVPVSFWPPWLQLLARGLPVTHGLAAVRALLGGQGARAVLGSLGLELLVFAGWSLAAVCTIDFLAGRGRADGSIDLT